MMEEVIVSAMWIAFISITLWRYEDVIKELIKERLSKRGEEEL